MKLSNLSARLLTVAPLIPIILLAVFWRHPEGLWAIVFVASLLALHEFFDMTQPDDRVARIFGIALGGLSGLLSYWGGRWGLALVPLLVVAPAIYYLVRFGDLQTVASRLALTSFGVVYGGILLSYVALLKRDAPHGGAWVLLTLLIAWLGDTCAYFAGRLLGRRKLYPAISPAKTWAGAIGGLAGSFLAGVLANLWFLPELGWGHGAVLTLVGGALGQSGDLFESMLKRGCGVKDSGRLLPGHGGILDRIDAVLFIAPFVYVYVHAVWQ